MAFQKPRRRRRFVEVVRPVSPKDLADAEARRRVRELHKGLLSKPGTPAKPIAVLIVRD